MILYGISSLTSSLINSASAEENRKQSYDIHTNNLQLQKRLEKARQDIQEKQMALSFFQQKDNQEFQKELAKQNQEFQLKIEQYRQSINIAINDKNINFQKWRFEREKELQLELLNLNQQFQRDVISIQHQNAIAQIRGRIEEDRFPLLNMAHNLLNTSSNDGVMPLTILLSPPELDHDVHKDKDSKRKIESFISEELRQFLKQGYQRDNKEYATYLLDKAWSTKKRAGGSAVSDLFKALHNIPVLFLESEFVDNKINLRYYFWDGRQDNPSEGSLLSHEPIFDFLFNSAKERAKKWRQTRNRLLKQGLNEELIRKRAKPNNEENLIILEGDEEFLAKHNIEEEDLHQLNIGKNYKLSQDDYDAFYKYLAALHSLTVGMMADTIAFSRSCQNIPLLPKLLSSLLSKIDSDTERQHEIVSEVTKFYHQIYHQLETNSAYSNLVPDLVLDLALAFTDLNDMSFSVTEANYSVSVWLKLHRIEPDKIFDFRSDEDCRLLKSIIYQEDEDYLTKLQQLVDKVDDTIDGLEQIKSLLAGWQNLKRWGVKIPSLPDVNQSKVKDKKVEIPKPHSSLTEEEFSFEVIIFEPSGTVKSREIKTNQQQVFDLGGVKLEMVRIPGGTFMMGYSGNGVSSDHYFNSSRICFMPNSGFFSSIHEKTPIADKPLHKVRIEPFYMSKYPITQAQYKTIIGENFTPSQAWNHPVVKVDYNDAINFCNKLKSKIGKSFRLPSEAQWEYACRAGTNTCCYFGDFQKDCNEPYILSRFYRNYQRPNEQHPIPVGKLPPNAFGLYDMEGNVLQWCEDYWHDNYNDAPTDGSAWNVNGSFDCKVIRGSFVSNSSYGDYVSLLYSSNRSYQYSVAKDENIGFRIIF